MVPTQRPFTPPASRGSIAAATAAGSDGRRRQALVVTGLGLATALLTLVLLLGISRQLAAGFVGALSTSLPAPPEFRVTTAFFDDTPTPVTVSVGWQRLDLVVPAWRILSDRTLWRAMRLEDWNKLPDPLRTKGLLAMLRRYRATLAGPGVWSTMDALAWDAVPSPVRVPAFLGMIDAHVERMARGGTCGQTEREISDTVAAIVMVESWFEHRAVNVNGNGERDLGLAQASARCRRRLRQLCAEGRIAVGASEEDYFDPWKASEVAVFWYLRELRAAEGDESLAIRAYHTGMKAARAGRGNDYLHQVVAKRRRFIRNEAAPPSWQLAVARTRWQGIAGVGQARAALTAQPLADARSLAHAANGTALATPGDSARDIAPVTANTSRVGASRSQSRVVPGQ